MLWQKSFPSIEGLAIATAWLSKEGYDAYHAVAGFRTDADRKQENVDALASLITDIDTQESKPNARYKNCEEAYLAVVAFCTQAAIPLPVFVASGGGLHCYWPLLHALDMREWKRLSNLLKLAAFHFQLAIDPSRTADAASVLRTPGTIHYGIGQTVRYGDLVGPYEIAQFDSLKRFENGLHDSRRTSTQLTPSRNLGSPLLGEVFGPSTSDVRTVFNTCSQLRAVAMAPGEFGEPMHYAASGIAILCGKGGFEYYESKLDSEYRAVAKFKAEQWSRGTGNKPATCTHIRGLNPDGCNGCEFWGKITTPIELGRGWAKKEATQPKLLAPPVHNTDKQETHQETYDTLILDDLNKVTLPEPFAWSQKGELIFRKETHGEADYDIVSYTPIYLASVNTGETHGNHTYTFRQWVPNSGYTNIPIAASRIKTINGVHDLADFGANVNNAQLFVSYVRAAVDDWRSKNRLETSYEQCGWKGDDFLAGKTLYFNHGNGNTVHTRLVAVNEELRIRAGQLGPRPGARLEAWKEVANTVLKPMGPVPTWMTMASFGSILLPFVAPTEGGTILSAVSKSSGTGKTMGLETSSSVWGTKHALAMTSIDTAASRGLVFSAVKNFPVYFDEFGLLIRKIDPDLVRDFVMLHSQGTDKLRAQQFGRGIQHAPHTWCNFLMTASNQSVIDYLTVFNIQTDAPTYRILEMGVDYPEHHDYAGGQKLRDLLQKHSGVAGDACLRHLLVPANLEYARKACDDAVKQIYKLTKWGPKLRFRVQAIGATLVGGIIMRELGLLDIDPFEVTRAIVEEQMRIEGPELTAIEKQDKMQAEATDILGDFLTGPKGHLQDMLVVKCGFRPGVMEVNYVLSPPRRNLLVRYENDNGLLLTPVKEWRRWLVSEGYNVSEVQKALTIDKVIVADKRIISLGAGAKIPSAPQACIAVDMRHPAMSQIARDVREQFNLKEGELQ